MAERRQEGNEYIKKERKKEKKRKEITASVIMASPLETMENSLVSSGHFSSILLHSKMMLAYYVLSFIK